MNINQKHVFFIREILLVFQFLFVSTAHFQTTLSQVLPSTFDRQDETNVNTANAILPKKTVYGMIKAKNRQKLFQVSLQLTASNDHFCNGAIVESHFVLTTAFCVHR